MSELMKPGKSDYFLWDVKNWSLALPFWDEYIPKGEGKSALELGSREGGLSLWLASLGFDVTCTDLESPATIAGPIHQKFEYSGKIHYESLNALEILKKEAYDVVVAKSILGGIARNGRDEAKQVVIQNMFEALKPGGWLFMAENLEATKLHSTLRNRFTNWGAGWNYLKIDEVPNLLSEFEFFSVKTAGFTATFGRSEGQRRILSEIDKLTMPLIPEKWRYIAFIAARKGASD